MSVDNDAAAGENTYRMESRQIQDFASAQLGKRILPDGRIEPAVGNTLDVETIPDNFSAEPLTPLRLDVTDLPELKSPKKRFAPLGDNWYELNYPDIEIDDLTPAFRDLVGDNAMRAKQMLFWSPDAIEGDLHRASIRKLQEARAQARPEKLALDGESLKELSAKSGMTEEETRYWQERDPALVANQLTDRQLLRLVGPNGYTARRMQTVDGAERLRENAVALGQAEAWMLGFWTDGLEGSLRRVGYDLRVGVGNMGLLGVKAMAGVAQAAKDIAGIQVVDAKFTRKSFDNAGPGVTGIAAEYWQTLAKDAEARWLGPAINTGNPVTDWTRTAVFQGTPFLAGSVGLAMIPGVGAAGAAAVIGGTMGMETYGVLRADGVHPLLAAGAAGGAAVTSYYLNAFQLNRWTRNLQKLSPFRRFSVGSAIETGQEFLSEAGESLGQGVFEATARLAGAPGFTRDQWWRETKEAAYGAFQEGAAAGVLSLATRIPGAPRAVRAQARTHAFNKNFKKTVNAIGDMKLYTSGQDAVIADHLNQTAKHHGVAGILFASIQDLQQTGLTREELVAGLGVSEDEYNYARDNNVDLAIPYGHAAVFAKRQADAGNDLLQNVLRADPDAMTGREIVEQEKEMTAVLEQAEANFAVMENANDDAIPERIKIFRAGLRAAGFDANEADATAALFWSRAQRAGELWGESPEAWLERQDVQLEFQSIIRDNRAMKRYQDLMELSRLRRDAAGGYVSPDVGIAETTGQDVFASSPGRGVAQAAQQNVEAAPQDGAAIAQPDVREMLQPVATAEENRQWIDEAAENLADAAGIEDESRGAVVEEAKRILTATSEMPEARQVAEQLGLFPAPAAGGGEQEAAGQAPASAGRRTKVIFPPESGKPPLPAQYALVELSTLQPSHIFRNYTPNPAWTTAELAQQRNYDSGAMEAVRQGIELDRLDYDAVFNPGTDAINGPPVVTPDGKVLGGNNRTHRIHNRYQEDAYRENLIYHLSTDENLTGIQPAAALAMENPVLVRVADDVDAEDIPGLIGALNADFTNRRDPANLAANRGMRVGERTLAAFAGIGDQTVAAFLDSPANAGRVLQAMVEDGALQNTDLPSLYDFANDKWLGDGRSSGKAQIEQALFGAILPDSRLLDELSDGMKKKLVRALPGLIRLKRNNAPELASLFDAVELHNQFQEFKESPQVKGLKTAAKLEEFRAPTQGSIFTGRTEAEKSGPAWEMFLELNGMRTQKDVADYFTRKADEIAGMGRGLFDLAQSPVEELYQEGTNGGDYERKARVVNLDPLTLVDDGGNPLNLKNRKAIANWIRKKYQGSEVTIADDGTIQKYTGKRLEASTKRRGDAHRQMYADLDSLLQSALFDQFEAADERHQNLIGQKVYYAAAKIGSEYYSIRFKIDIPKVPGRASYKDHKVAEVLSDVEIEMAPSLYRTDSDASSRTQNKGTINYISLPVLKGIVKPSIVSGNTLYQDDDLNSPRGAIRFQPATNAPTIIRLFRNADVSTVVHELNHLFVRDLANMVEAGKGGERARADLAALTAFAGDALDSAGYEKIAEAWERYALEGHAPSPELYDAFDTFREYIGRVYQHAKHQLNVQPSEEVRAVFDRWLATDAQIAEARALQEQAGYWFDAAQGIDAAAKERLRTLNQRVERAKRRDMDARLGGGKALGRAGKNNLSDIRARIRGEEANTPAFRAIANAKKAGGFDRAEVEALIGRPGAEEMAARHGEDIFGGEANLSGIADASGYRNSEEMLANIAGVQAVEDKVRTDIESELAAEDEAAAQRGESDGAPDGEDVVDIEEEGLVAQVEESIRAAGGGARGLRAFRLKYQAMKIAAQQLVGAKALREAVDLRRFQSAKRDANRKALAAAKRGDLAKITECLNLELMHHLTIRECTRARELRERMEKRYGTRALLAALEAKEHTPKVENVYAEAVKAVATFVGLTGSRRLRPQTNGETIPFPTYEANSNVAEFLPDMAGSVEPWLLNKVYPEGYQNWRDFSVDQLREVDRVMTMLLEQGSGKLNALRDIGAENLRELVAKSTAPMTRRKTRPKQRDDRPTWDRTLDRINKYLISITIPENWFMAMDGNPTISGKEAGINQRLFWKMRDCQLVKDKLYKDMLQGLAPHFACLEQAKKDIEARFGGDRFLVPGLEIPDIMKQGRDYHTWDADLLLSIALNMGNDASFYRLTGIIQGKDKADIREGCFNFTEEELAVVAGQFTADQWRAIQGVWDGIGSLYGQLDAVTFRITNRHVMKEKAMPLTVTTADGEALALKGGYFPLVNDPLLSDRADQLRERGDIESAIHAGVMDTIHQSTKPAAGMIKERARDEDGNPVVRLPQLLRTNIMIKHLDTATHYISHAETILELDRLTRNEDWRGMYVAKFGADQYHAVRKWIENLAHPNRLDNSVAGQCMEKMRSLATVGALGLRLKTGIKQRLGYAQAINFMTDASRTRSSGWKWMISGWREMGVMGNLLGRNREKIDFVNDLSDFMRARQGAHDRELRAQVEKLNPLKTEMHIPFTGRSVDKRKLHDYMFAWIQANDTAAAYAAWLGGYKQALAGEANFALDGLTEEQIHDQAVRYADSVAATQASSFAADLTEMQRDTGVLRFLSMFMSGSVRQGSRLMQYIDAYHLGDKTKGNIAWLAFREFAAPALAWVSMGAALQHMVKCITGGGDDDTLDNLLTAAAWEVAETTIAPFPLVREIVSAARYGPARVPAVEGPTKAIGGIYRAPGKVLEGRALKGIADTMSGFGFFLGVPVMNPINEARTFARDMNLTE